MRRALDAQTGNSGAAKYSPSDDMGKETSSAKRYGLVKQKFRWKEFGSANGDRTRTLSLERAAC